jgi:2-dehydropantoate 2-reductase
VTLKTTANGQFGELVGPVLKPESIILTLQNGLGNEERLCELFGAERVLGGMAFVCLNRIGPGQIVHSDHGLIRLGEVQGGMSRRAARIAEIFQSSGVPCQVVENLAWGRWDKLVWNVPFNGLGAVLDMTTDRLIGSEAGLKMVKGLMQEVIDAAAALGLAFAQTVIEEKIHHTLTMGGYKTSMQIDREAGRAMEVESIIGQPLSLALRNNVPTPGMEMLYSMLRLVDGPKESA